MKDILMLLVMLQQEYMHNFTIKLIDYEMVEQWVDDLVINKTFNGMYVQKAILAFLAEQTDQSYRLATPDEEAKGIDGYVGGTAYSIKPDTYKTMGGSMKFFL